MKRAALIAVIVADVPLVALVLDHFVDNLSGAVVMTLRTLVVIAAVAVAGIAYQIFSTKPPRTPALIASIALGLIGGAIVASVTTSAPDGRVYSSLWAGLAGTLALIWSGYLMMFEASKRQTSTKE